MDIKELNKVLHESCLANDICEEYEEKWGNKILSQQELIDFIKREYLFIYRLPEETFAIVKENFDTDLMHKNGIFIDGDVITELESDNKNNSFYFLGNAKGNITVNKGRYNIYLYEKSNLDITVEGDAIVNIYVLAWSNLNVTGNGTKVVEVNHISKSAEIKSDGNVKIFDRIVIDKYIRAMWRKK